VKGEDGRVRERAGEEKVVGRSHDEFDVALLLLDLDVDPETESLH
jgi:hypothetical protein